MLNWKGLSGLALLLILTVVLPACDYININYPLPVIGALSPSSVVAGQPSFYLTVTGQSFVQGSVITWNGTSLTTIFNTGTSIEAQIPVALIAAPAAIQVTVTTPPPGGGTSFPLTFTISPAPSSTPQITSISPSSVLAGSGAVAINVYGHNFYNTSTITVNGQPESTNFSNSSPQPGVQQLSASIPGAVLVSAGQVDIGVLNPQPGGGQAGPVLLPVNNPQPVLTSLSPTGVAVASTNTAVTLTGTGFVPTSVVTVNGSPRVTTFSNSTSVAVTLTSADTGVAGVAQIMVSNPVPGGGTSLPSILSINPTNTNGGGLPEMVDLSTTGGLPNNGVGNPGQSGPVIASTGQAVGFASIATNLAPNDSNGVADVFLRATCVNSGTCAQTTSFASSAASGVQGNADSLQPSMDLSGRYVGFTSQATDLNPTCPTPPGSTQSTTCNYVFTGTTRQVFLRDMGTTPGNSGTTSTTTTSTTTSAVYLVSAGVDGNPANSDAYSPAVSPDGRYVAFLSAATNLVSGSTSNGLVQVYLRDTCLGQTSDTCTPITYLISSPDGFTPGNQPSSQPAIASNGTYVSFTSAATNLIPGISPAGTQIYLNSTCIQSTTSCTVPVLSLISSPDGVSPANGNNSESTVTPDGRYYAFAATANPAVLNGSPLPAQQIYLLDTCTNATSTTIVSCTRTMTLISTPDSSLTAAPSTPGNQISEYPSLSNEGQYVAFASRATNLVTNTNNSFENVFVRNTCVDFVAPTNPTTTTPTQCLPTTFLRSASLVGVLGNGDSQFPQISNDGSTIAFLSAANNLVVNDTNTGVQDVFIASTCPIVQTFLLNNLLTTTCPGSVTTSTTTTTTQLTLPLQPARRHQAVPSGRWQLLPAFEAVGYMESAILQRATNVEARRTAADGYVALFSESNRRPSRNR